VPGLFDNLDFAMLFKQLGLRAGQGGTFRLPDSTPRIGSDFLNNDAQGAQALFELYTSQFDDATGRTLSRQFAPIYRKYQAASALNPNMKFEQFLDSFDQQRFIAGLTPAEQGRRDAAFTRGSGGFRYLEG
jgi:hypothetical protein